MKLNMDLIRKILLWCEDTLPDNSQSHISSEIVFQGHTPDEVAFHFYLLIEEGYIEAIDARDNSHRFDFFPENLTLNGYDFLEGIKSDTVWNGVKEEAERIGIKVFVSVIPVILNIIAKQAGLV